MKALKRNPENGEYVKLYGDENLYHVTENSIIFNKKKIELYKVYKEIETVYTENFEPFSYIGSNEKYYLLPLEGTRVYVVREYNAVRDKRIEEDVILEYALEYNFKNEEERDKRLYVRLGEYPLVSIPFEEIGKTIFLRKEHAEKSFNEEKAGK